MCYVGRLKGSMYLVNARLVVRNAAKTLQIRGWKGKGGATWGPNPWGGGETEDGNIYTFMV